jgi:hypothetical protein
MVIQDQESGFDSFSEKSEILHLNEGVLNECYSIGVLR